MSVIVSQCTKKGLHFLSILIKHICNVIVLINLILLGLNILIVIFVKYNLSIMVKKRREDREKKCILIPILIPYRVQKPKGRQRNQPLKIHSSTSGC